MKNKILILLLAVISIAALILPGCEVGTGASGDNVYQGPTFTSGGVPIVDADGTISTDTDLTFSGDTLTATGIDAPTGRTATYVIAASDATATEKAQADITCIDTTEDEFATALNALNTIGGGTLQLTTGTYTFNKLDDTKALAIPANIIIQGQGYNTVLKLANTQNITCFLYIITHNVTLMNLRIDCNGLNQTSGAGIYAYWADGLKTQNIWVTNSYGSSISLNATIGADILNTKITTPLNGAPIILNAASQNIKIINPQIDGTGMLTAAPAIHGTGISTDVLILGGRIQNFPAHTSARGIFFDTTCKRITVDSVNIYNSWNGVASGAEATKIVNCTAVNIGDDGVGTGGNAFDIGAGKNSLITGCTATNVVECGLCAEGTGQIVANNIIENAGVGGSFLKMRNGGVTHNVIKGSNHVLYPYGIWAIGTVGTFAQNNLIQGNKCFDDADTSVTSLLTGNASSAQKVVAVVDGTLFMEGQSVTIDDDTPFTEDNVIRSISENNLTMSVALTNTYTTAQNAKVTVRKSQTYGIIEGAYTTDIKYIDNICFGNITDQMLLTNNGSKNLASRNTNYIAPGETRTYSGSIATLTENAFNSLDNPFGQAVRVMSLDIYVSTGATATAPNIDCGIGASATTDYTTLTDDLPGETTGFYKSTIATPGTQTVPILWESGSGNRYLNMSIKDAAATGMVATYTVTVMGN